MAVIIPTEFVTVNSEDGYSHSPAPPPGTETDGSGGVDIGLTNLMRIGRNTSLYSQGGVRFRTVPIPAGVVIVSASISLWSHPIIGTRADTVNWKIKGLDVDDATSAWSVNYRPGTGGAPGRGPETTAGVDWDRTGFVRDTLYISPDISPVVQEIVDRVGWALNNEMAFIIRNDGVNLGEAFMRQRIVNDIGNARANRFDCTYNVAGASGQVMIFKP